MTTNTLSNKFLQILDLIRFSNPTGWTLLFFPCAIGVGLEGSLEANYKELLLFFIGSIIMRSTGCIINDIWDRDIDRQVSRTKNRPLASGVLNIREALVVFIFLAAIGFVILWQFNKATIIVGLVAALLLAVYPLSKRFFACPQLILGITYSMGVLIASTAITGTINKEAIICYIGCVLWTIYYDTIYAFMDLADDEKIAVGSFAKLIARMDYKLLLLLIGLTSMLVIATSLVLSIHDFNALMFATFICSTLIFWQVFSLRINNPANCLERFKNNNWIGIVWMVVALGH